MNKAGSKSDSEWLALARGFQGAPSYEVVLGVSVSPSRSPLVSAAALPVASLPVVPLQVVGLIQRLVPVAVRLVDLCRGGYPLQLLSLQVAGCFYRRCPTEFAVPGCYFCLVHFRTTFSSG